MKKRLLGALVGIALMLTGCSTPSTEDTAAHEETQVVVDNVGREVEVPTEVDGILAVGAGGPRFISYMGLIDQMMGAEEIDQGDLRVQFDYANVHHERLNELPIVGAGSNSATNNAYAEPIIELQPDVIFAGFETGAAEELQRQTGIPVVSILYRGTGFIDQDFADTLSLIADVTGEHERASELMDYINEVKADLKERVPDIPDSEKPRAYNGAVNYRGSHGFNFTYVDLPAFNAVEAVNVADELMESEDFSERGNGVEVDWEQIAAWNPDVIFLDPGNMHLVTDEYRTRPDYFNSLRAVQEDQVYTMPATNAAGANITYLLINAYHTGKVLYPEQFADVDLAAKAGEIMTVFLGEDFFKQMNDGGLYYGKIRFDQ